MPIDGKFSIPRKAHSSLGTTRNVDRSWHFDSSHRAITPGWSVITLQPFESHSKNSSRDLRSLNNVGALTWETACDICLLPPASLIVDCTPSRRKFDAFCGWVDYQHHSR